MIGSSIGQPPTALAIDELMNALDMGKFLSLPGEILLRGEKALENLERVLKVAAARRAAQEADEAAKEAKQKARELKRTLRKLEEDDALEKGLPPPKKETLASPMPESEHSGNRAGMFTF